MLCMVYFLQLKDNIKFYSIPICRNQLKYMMCNINNPFYRTHSSLYNVIDLGCGTGVLGFIANDVLLRSLKDKEINIYSLDNIENAVKSAKINA